MKDIFISIGISLHLTYFLQYFCLIEGKEVSGKEKNYLNHLDIIFKLYMTGMGLRTTSRSPLRHATTALL